MEIRYPEFGRYLSDKRSKTGKSQRALAKDSPVSYGAIGQYETGRALPSYAHVPGLAKAYHVEVAELTAKLVEVATLPPAADSGDTPGWMCLRSITRLSQSVYRTFVPFPAHPLARAA